MTSASQPASRNCVTAARTPASSSGVTTSPDALSEEYDVSRVRLDGKIDALSVRSEGITFRANNFEAAIVAKPDSLFSEKDRFILDQFIMNGG